MLPRLRQRPLAIVCPRGGHEGAELPSTPQNSSDGVHEDVSAVAHIVQEDSESSDDGADSQWVGQDDVQADPCFINAPGLEAG